MDGYKTVTRQRKKSEWVTFWKYQKIVWTLSVSSLLLKIPYSPNMFLHTKTKSENEYAERRMSDSVHISFTMKLKLMNKKQQEEFVLFCHWSMKYPFIILSLSVSCVHSYHKSDWLCNRSYCISLWPWPTQNGFGHIEISITNQWLICNNQHYGHNR